MKNAGSLSSIVNYTTKARAEAREDSIGQGVTLRRHVRFRRTALVWLLLLAGIVLYSPCQTRAATKTSTGSGNWNTAGTWSPSGAPGATDDVVIASGHTVSYDGGNSTILSLTTNGTGTLSFNNNASETLTVSGDLTNNGTIQCVDASGTRTHTLSLKGNFTNNGSFIAVGGDDRILVTFTNNTGVTQTIAGTTTFFNLTLNNSTSTTSFGTSSVTIANTLTTTAGTMDGGTSTMTFTGAAGTMTGGNVKRFYHLVINAGASITNSSSNIEIKGNFTNNGSFTPGAVNVTFNGSASQNMGGSTPTTFNNLIINNSAGVALSTNATVSGNLALTSGDLNTGASTLFMGNGATSSGTMDVIGNVNRSDLNGGTARSFGNPFVQITETAGTVSDITVNLVRSAPSDFGNALSRTYTITPNGGTSLVATLQLHYLDYELNGNTEASLELWRKDSTLGWQLQGRDAIGGNDTTNNWVKLSSVTQFSPWTLGTSAPTDVALMKFNAVSDPQGRVLLEWQSGYEVGNLGFNLYRDVGGKRTRINPSLIGGTALLAGSRTPFTAGFAYAWIDSSAPSKALSSYWLEDLDASGKTLLHGPIFPISVSSLPPQAQSLTVSQLNHTAPGTTLATLSVARAAAASLPSRRLSSLSLQAQWQVAARNGAKLLIRKSGWYRVSQPQLVAAGFDVSKDPRFYQLFVDGAELPLLINGGQSGRLDPTDSIEFYAAALDSPTTTQRALFLTNGTQAGRRLPQLPFADGKPSARTTFTAVLDQRDRFIYVPSINNGDAENWFGAFIYSNPYDMPMSLSRVDPDAADPAVVEVALQGLGSDSPPQAHVVRVQVNGQEAGTISFSGTQHQVGRLSVSARLLKEGQNTVTLTGVGGAGDHSLLDWTRLSYPHRLVADENRLLMTARQDEQVQVSGFSTARVRVFDVTDEANPVELGAKVEQAGLGYRVTATAQEVGERVLLVVGERAYEQAQVVAQVGSSWHESSQGADVVMVVGAGLSGALEPLVAMRKQQGYVVAVVEVEDAYDEFSYGQKTAQAVQDLVAATRQWKRVPKWLLLVGDASYDPKNYTELGEWDLVPTKAAWVNTMEAASDEWLGDVNGDGLAEVAVGRLPVRNVAQAQAVVAKIVGYRPTTNDGAILVADRNDGFDFETTSTTIQGLLPAGMRSQQIYRRLMDDQTASQAIIDAVNRGPKLVNYAGHGSASLWRGNLLTTSSVAQMTNGQALPVVVSMTCLNGMYTDPYLTSLGEALLLSGQGGAIAVWASSAQTVAGAQELVDQEMVRQLLNGVGGKGRPLTIGEAIQRAKAVALDESVTRSWILLGDPMTTVH